MELSPFLETLNKKEKLLLSETTDFRNTLLGIIGKKYKAVESSYGYYCQEGEIIEIYTLTFCVGFGKKDLFLKSVYHHGELETREVIIKSRALERHLPQVVQDIIKNYHIPFKEEEINRLNKVLYDYYQNKNQTFVCKKYKKIDGPSYKLYLYLKGHEDVRLYYFYDARINKIMYGCIENFNFVADVELLFPEEKIIEFITEKSPLRLMILFD